MGLLWLVLILGGFGARPFVEEREWLRSPLKLAEMRDEDGDYFGNPWGMMVALPGGGFVLNDDGVILRAFNVDGTVRWIFGGRGGGPGEFQNIQDMSLTAEGKVLVLDADAVRITILDATTGELLETVPVGQKAAGGLSEIMSVGPPHLAVVQHRDTEDGNWSVLDVTGAVVRTYTLPPSCEALVCEAFAEGVTENGEGVVAFRWSSDLVFLNADGSVRKVQDGVEPMRMPDPVSYEIDPADLGLRGGRYSQVIVTKVDPKATEATRSLAVGGSRVFVLALGSTENRGRIVDIYTMETGNYEGSFLFPWPVREIAVIDEDILAALSSDFFPVVTLWNIGEL